MRIDGKITGDLCKLKLAYDEKNEERWAAPHVRMMGDHKQVADLFGQDFADMCFRSVKDLPVADAESSDSPPVRFGYDEIKPNLMFEMHALTVYAADGTRSKEIATQPKIVNVRPRAPFPVVTVEIAFPFELGADNETAGALAVLFGEAVTCKLTPRQTDMFSDTTARTNGRSRTRNNEATT